MANPPQITIYTTPTCPYCHSLMDWLDQIKIPYTEAPATPAIHTVPTTIIGTTTIIGFDRPAIIKALKKHSITP